MEPVIFAYNFPHKKTHDFIVRLVVLGYTPRAVLAADPVKLNLPPSPIRTKPRHCDLFHPRRICEQFQIPYHVVNHSGDQCVDVLRGYGPDIGVVAGARILPRKVIECFSRGIVNFHPGLIPDVRGLDALQWAIYHDLPIGVTAHIIDHRVDAGRIIDRRVIREYPDDTLIDLSLRLYETQIDMLENTIKSVATDDLESFKPVTGGNYRRSFPADLVPDLFERFEARHARLKTTA